MVQGDPSSGIGGDGDERPLPLRAVFIEERYLRDLFCYRLGSICATRASLPHVDVAQDFQGFVQQRLPGNRRAGDDSEEVSRLLNDDGHGVNNARNAAVGYRLARASDLFARIADLPADRLEVPEAAQVDMPARFTPAFVDAQIRLNKAPREVPGDPPIQAMIRKLLHTELVISAISDFVRYPMASNARTIYSPATKALYDAFAEDMLTLLADAMVKTVRAAKMIEAYGDGVERAGVASLTQQVEGERKAVESAWLDALSGERPWWQAVETDTAAGAGGNLTERQGRWAGEMRMMEDRIRRRLVGEVL